MLSVSSLTWTANLSQILSSIFFSSWLATKVIASPLVPNLPALPTLCKQLSVESGISKLKTILTLAISIPLPKTSVVTMTLEPHQQNSLNLAILSCCFIAPWQVIAGMVYSFKYLHKKSALSVLRTKMMTWLNQSQSINSRSLLIFSFSEISR